jgi:hypothetical protein
MKKYSIEADHRSIIEMYFDSMMSNSDDAHLSALEG